MVLCGEERADVALEDEVGPVATLDGLDDRGVGGVHQFADVTADRGLPIRQAVDVGVHAWISGVRQGALTVHRERRYVLGQWSGPGRLLCREALTRAASGAYGTVRCTGLPRTLTCQV